MMNRILLSGALMLFTVLSISAQELPPVLDSGFGIKNIGLNLETSYENFLGFEQSPDGGFYLAGYERLVRLGSDGTGLWSVSYDSAPDNLVVSPGGLFADDENNAYVVVNNWRPWGVPTIVKYSPEGTQIKKQGLPLSPELYPAAVSLTGSRADGRIYVSAEYEYYDNGWKRKVFLGCLDKNLAFVSSLVFTGPNWDYRGPFGAISADNAGDVYYAGATPEDSDKLLIRKYTSGFSGVEWEARPDEYSDFDAVLAAGAAGVSVASPRENYVLWISSEGAGKWRVPMPYRDDFYAGLAVDDAGNVYTGSSAAGYGLLAKFNSSDGNTIWSLSEQSVWFLHKVLVDNQNRIYTIGESRDDAGVRYYIARYLQGGDAVAPAAVSDLAAASVSSDSITLSWTAPGDDGITGTASGYDIRYSTIVAIVSDVDFNSAAQAEGEPTPQVAGSAETFTLPGLTPGTTYFFALKTGDEAGNISGLSNSPKGITTAVPKYKYAISGSTVPAVVVVSTWSAPLVSLVNIFGATNPAAGIGVDFTISTFPAGAEGFSLSKSSEAANAQGLADVLLKLGNIPAEYGVTATCNSCEASASSVTFTCCGKLTNTDFKQYDVAWSTHSYDGRCHLIGSTVPFNCNPQSPPPNSVPFTIRQRGCAMTAMADVLNYYHDRYALAYATTTPLALNQYLRNNNGFDNGNVRFEKIADYTVSAGKTVCLSGRSNFIALSASTRKKIDNNLADGNPVILKVPSDNNPSHFVVAVGKCEGSYLVADPGSSIRTRIDPASIRGIREFALVDGGVCP